MVFVGDGNNVASELAIACAYVGMDFTLCGPKSYWFDSDFVESCNQLSQGRSTIACEADPAKAVANADLVYTDVWASMGQESEKARRDSDFKNYQVNAALLANAKPTVRFLHCLPAHRGEEVTAEIIDGPMSAVVQQAENRLHAQKALMLWLLKDANPLRT